MKRRPRAALAVAGVSSGAEVTLPFDPNFWLSASEAAAYLKIFRRKDGKPSVGAIRNLVYRRLLRAYKPFGRLIFSRKELDARIEASRLEGYSYGS